MNKIVVNFTECEPEPAGGYNLKWRVAGSADPYTDEGNFSGSPITFYDGLNPDGTNYEGIVASDCAESGESGGLTGNPVSWSTSESSGDAYVCGYFYVIVDNDSNEGHSMNEKDTLYASITIGANTYLIGEYVVQGESPGVATTVNVMNFYIPDLGVFEFMAVTQLNLTKRTAINLYFTTLASKWDSIEMKVTNFGMDLYLKPIAATCDDYPQPV